MIVRTIAKGRAPEDLEQDLRQLQKDWDKITQRARSLPAGTLIFRDAGMVPALVRDQFSPDIGKLIIDEQDEFKKTVEYVRQVAPELVEHIELYGGKEPIFDHFSIEKQIDAMMRRSVRLSGGGEIVIDQTEALIAIDVNTGRFVGKRDYEDMILRVNLEAADEIARQLRLRDLGGLIVIDFIDMERREHIARLERAFDDAIRNDRAHTRILGINDFGVMMLTRQRVQQSLLGRITDNCPVCAGVGRIYSPSTMVANIERWLIRAKSEFRGEAIILVHPTVAEEFLSEGAERIADFKRAYGIGLTVFADTSVHPDAMRILDAKTGQDIGN